MLMVPTWLVALVAITALVSLMLRYTVERRAALLIKLPAFAWYALIYTMLSVPDAPQPPAEQSINGLRLALILLLSSVAIYELAAMLDVRRIRGGQRD